MPRWSRDLHFNFLGSLLKLEDAMLVQKPCHTAITFAAFVVWSNLVLWPFDTRVGTSLVHYPPDELNLLSFAK